MAVIAKSGAPSISTAAPPTTVSLSGLHAGEALAAGDACYIKSADGLVYRSDGGAVGTAAVVDGYAPTDCPIGEATSLYWDVNFRYGSGLTPGIFVYLGTTGALSDVATTGGTNPIGRVIDATRIWLTKSY